MVKKGKQIVWHKKKGKFISSSVLKIHGKVEKETVTGEQEVSQPSDKIKNFAKKLTQEIKKACE